MPTSFWLRRLPLALPLLLLALGCSKGANASVPVTGKVTYKGMTVQGGTIVFTPDASHGQTGAIAIGEIRADGTYNLKTDKAFGTVAGWYRVTVAAVTSTGQVVPGQRYPSPYSLVPEKYRDPELSHLTCEVKADRANSIDFNLE